MPRPVKIELTAYKLTESEAKVLRDAETMELINREAKKISEEMSEKEGRAHERTDMWLHLVNKMARERGYKGYTFQYFAESIPIKEKIFAYEQGQRDLLLSQQSAEFRKKRRPRRQQTVAGIPLLSRFEIEVWRGVYRFVLRNRGCYDPALSFRELRDRYPLTQTELFFTVLLAGWISCSAKAHSNGVVLAFTETVIKALLHPELVTIPPQEISSCIPLPPLPPGLRN
jgi:hypothetical protein